MEGTDGKSQSVAEDDIGPKRRIRQRLQKAAQLCINRHFTVPQQIFVSSKQNRMSWVGHMASTRANRNTYRILAGKPEEK
jgi:beta-galactosidase/beta-glucuronidase